MTNSEPAVISNRKDLKATYSAACSERRSASRCNKGNACRIGNNEALLDVTIQSVRSSLQPHCRGPAPKISIFRLTGIAVLVHAIRFGQVGPKKDLPELESLDSTDTDKLSLRIQ